jgi:hypothetical protein
MNSALTFTAIAEAGGGGFWMSPDRIGEPELYRLWTAMTSSFDLVFSPEGRRQFDAFWQDPVTIDGAQPELGGSFGAGQQRPALHPHRRPMDASTQSR